MVRIVIVADVKDGSVGVQGRAFHKAIPGLQIERDGALIHIEDAADASTGELVIGIAGITAAV